MRSSESIPGSSSRTVLLNVAGFLQSFQVILDRVAIGAGRLRGMSDGHTASFTAKLENQYRKLRQISENQSFAFDLPRKPVLLFSMRLEKVT